MHWINHNYSNRNPLSYIIFKFSGGYWSLPNIDQSTPFIYLLYSNIQVGLVIWWPVLLSSFPVDAMEVSRIIVNRWTNLLSFHIRITPPFCVNVISPLCRFLDFSFNWFGRPGFSLIVPQTLVLFFNSISDVDTLL